jgi:hypothetical protein
MLCKKIKNACDVIDTACTIDEQFERPWQPLKGISIKNMYVPEFCYPNTTKISRETVPLNLIYYKHSVTYLTKHIHNTVLYLQYVDLRGQATQM